MVRVALTLSFLAFAVLAPAAQAASDETRIIIGRDPGLSGAERADIRHDAGVELDHTLRIPNTEVVTTGDARSALAKLRKDPDVRYAEIDRVRHALTSDPDFHFQWALDNTGTNISDAYVVPDGTADADMDVPDAWAQSTGSGVLVAVVDTVVETTHPDLVHNIASSANFVSVEADPADPGYTDERDHGTHVAGIIAAERNNGIGVSGIAPDARIMGLRVLDNAGSGFDSDISDAFDYAADHGARVVNASLGGPGGDGIVLRDAIHRHPNTLFVVAAGNGGADGIGDNNDATPDWPCSVAEPNLLCVGASTDTDHPAGFSNYGVASVDLFAPGTLIWSTVRGGLTDYMSGTSMASPAVAAEAALVLAARPDLTTAALRSAILGTAEVKPAFAGKSVTGGRANAQAAVASIAPAHPVDTDGDGIPDAADRTPGKVDADGDGVIDTVDACPAVAAATANGCPAPVVSGGTPYVPPPVVPAAPDADGDGRPDASDLCPGEAAATTTGCPVPALRSLGVKVVRAKHRATVTVRTTRAATVALTVERRVCNSHGRNCRWRTAASQSRSTKGEVATFSVRKLARGRYRAVVQLSSPAGRAKLARQSFKL